MKHRHATDKTSIVDLIMESKAEVVEVVEDLTEEDDDQVIRVWFSITIISVVQL
jgi:hypothetical protein